MLKTFLLTLFTTTALYTAMAQQPGTDPSSQVLQSCLLGTKPGVWAELKLSPDQMERVRRVQEACQEECDVAGAKKDESSISNADGSTIMSELDNILSSEQYRAWVDYCKGIGTDAAPPK